MNMNFKIDVDVKNMVYCLVDTETNMVIERSLDASKLYHLGLKLSEMSNVATQYNNKFKIQREIERYTNQMMY